MIPNSPAFVRTFFPSAMWNAPTDAVCLTFDDGPHPKATPLILDVLRSYGIDGTFFLVGTNVAQYPEIARETIRLGHTVGNHSYDHSLLFFRSRQFVAKQIAAAAKEIHDATKTTSYLFRPPYGYFRPSLLETVHSTGHRLVMWSLDSLDWRDRTASAVSDRIVRKIHPGSIVLLHDNSNTVDRIGDILKRVLDSLMGAFKFSTLSHDR